MPELPEVETIKRGLSKIEGEKIMQIFRSNKKLRFDSSLDLSLIEGEKINKIERRARYLIIEIGKNYALIIHLGMSGRLILHADFEGLDNYKIQKHDHFICELKNHSLLVFNDPRRFGMVDLVLKKDISEHKMLKKLGPEPFSDEFNPQYLSEKLKNKSTNIKTTMMDNEIVVGVGNIYINESLFAAKISPLRKANSLSKKEIEILTNTIKSTLEVAINSGGSSINDYVDSDGNLGNFQNNFKIYGLAKTNCVKCKTEIEKIVQNGRSTFYCKKCQK
jgi:formamidopyrimidine-DNA glycosylase